MTKLQLNADGTELQYKLIVANIENVIAAHLHLAPAGTNGPVVVTLYSGPPTDGRFNGVLAEGVITAEDLEGPMSGMTIADLVAEIESGNIYMT